MSAPDGIELLVRVEGARTELLSPGVGIFSRAVPTATILAAGESAGILATLGVRTRLIVPAGVHGVVSSSPPARLHEPVGYGQVLYTLALVDSAGSTASPKVASRGESGEVLSLRSPQSGRFYHRSAPGEASLCEIGREIEVGTPIGLIEVMKTFTQVTYRAERGLPAQARILRVLAADGGDIDEGAVLLVVAPR